jgi:hypothetical protein
VCHWRSFSLFFFLSPLMPFYSSKNKYFNCIANWLNYIQKLIFINVSPNEKQLSSTISTAYEMGNISKILKISSAAFTSNISPVITTRRIGKYPFIALSQRFGPSKTRGEKTTRHLKTSHSIQILNSSN